MCHFCITFQSYLNHKCCHHCLFLKHSHQSLHYYENVMQKKISLLHTQSTKHEPSSIGILSTSSGDMKSECAAPENGYNLLAGTDKLSESTNKVWLYKFCNQQYSHKSSLSLHVSMAHKKDKGNIGCSIYSKR